MVRDLYSLFLGKAGNTVFIAGINDLEADLFSIDKSIFMFWYHVLDIFFMILHPLIILFNLFGWIWKKTRRANLVLLLLTGGSWFILGIFYGIGYCPFTHWHWEVLHHLGEKNLPNSYIKYLVQRLTGISFSDTLVDDVTAACYFVALDLSLYVNLKKKKQRVS